jgi:hypothetical protein
VTPPEAELRYWVLGVHEGIECVEDTRSSDSPKIRWLRGCRGHQNDVEFKSGGPVICHRAIHQLQPYPYKTENTGLSPGAGCLWTWPPTAAGPAYGGRPRPPTAVPGLSS